MELLGSADNQVYAPRADGGRTIACGEEQKPDFSKYLRRMGFELNEHCRSQRQRVTIFNK